MVNIDLATVTGSTPYTPSPPTRRSGSTTPAARRRPRPGSRRRSTARPTRTRPTGRLPPSTTKYLKLTLEPSVPTGSVVTGRLAHERLARLRRGHERRHPLLLPRDLQRRDLARHPRQRRLAAGVHERHDLQHRHVSLPEVNDATKANNLVIKLYYWVSPTCGGGGNPTCVKSVTDQAAGHVQLLPRLTASPFQGRGAGRPAADKDLDAALHLRLDPAQADRLDRRPRRRRGDRRARHLRDLHELDQREPHDRDRHPLPHLGPTNRLGTGASPSPPATRCSARST